MQNLEKLKAFCDKEGFDFDVHEKSGVVIISAGKEINGKWKDVEFAECLSDPSFYCKITSQDNLNIYFEDGWFDKDYAKPLTESAYKVQLEKMALEKYGEIKPNDTFMDEPNGFIRSCNKGMDNWHYSKEKDALFAFGARIYQQGKWATKLPQRVVVKLNRTGYFHNHKLDNVAYYNPSFIMPQVTEDWDIDGASKFLASQLEAFLNGEIPNPS